ncbi:MAG: hypothetical protein SAJ12_16885 [Jaaginema sp. PMC 1079.18]|nr:hypothetical protein [Jaaginema sp. PMC 1080.18]MEC4852659.1 hypothetical protein [Jaaginema sp. PMC 1079.18]MEC4864465.1 hypothetical protein [Jaaginema sp. PMC 1078.18]
MLSDITRQKQIIEKTVRKVCDGINAGDWRFSLKFSDNVDSGDIDEIYVAEGRAFCQEYEVSLSFESERSLKDIEYPESYKWYFSSNLKQSNREDPFVFKGWLDGVAIQYCRHRPEEKEILELVKDSINLLQEAQIAFDLQDIDCNGECSL